MNMMASTNYCNECGASNPSQATYCFACNNALHTPALSPHSHVQAASINATVLEGKAPLIPSYLLHSRYTIVNQVGTGGFGAVYKAKDTLFSHRLVAIKEMNQDNLSSRELAEATAAFEREALLLSDLTHPNLPHIHDHFSEHGRSYVVMDYIAGDTLEDYLDKVVQRLPIEMVLEIGIQLATVLDYLHATLHELLTGDDPSLTLFNFKPVPAGKRGKLPIASQLYALLKQMIEMDMSKRPASMAIVKQELQNLLAQQTPRSQSKTQAPVKRRRFLVGLASTVATCAITTYLVQNPNLLDLLFAHPFTGTTSVHFPVHLVPERATILNRSLHMYRGHKGTVTAVAWSADGQHIASPGSLDSSVQVWDAYTGNLVLLSHSHEKDLAIFATNPQRVDALAWSPDSTQIGAALGNDTIGVWSIETVDEKFFPFTTTGTSNALAWSPDGSRIAAVTWNNFVQVYSATTGTLSDTYPSNTQAVLTLA